QGVERSTIFHPHAAELRSRFRDIAVRIDVTVATGSDTEIRRITIANQSDRTRRISLVSYAELALAPMSLDERHPAFNKLFIESESVPEAGALVYRRRPRSSDDDPVFLAYSLVLEDAEAPSLGLFETDRARFIGRGSDASCPVALMGDGIVLTSATGATLDPVVVSHCELELAPYGEARIATVMTAARDRTTALTPVRRFQSWTQVTQAFEEAEGQSKIELHRLQLPTPQLQTVEQLLSALLYPTAALRATPETLTKNTLWQSGLWTHGISGDYPILLVRVRTRDHLDLLREALTAHCYWRARSVEIDLVILNEREEGYAQEFRGEIRRVLQRTKTEARLGQHGGIFIVTAAQLRPDERALLETTARAILDGERKTLADHLRGVLQPPATLPALAPTRPPSPSREAGTSYALQRPADLIFDNGLGGFSPDGTEYMIYLEPGAHTPAPWINVIANPEFGFLVSESGGGYTWAFNSGENRLTTWRNDPVSDMPSEAIYIRDEETVEIWSPTPLPAPADAPYLIRHSAGSTSFVHHSHELQQNVHLCVAPDAPVKIARLTLTNQSDRVRRITVTYYAEWVLGPSRSGTQQYIVSEFDAATNALLARNAYNADFGQQVAFVASDHSPHGVTTDRAEFLGLRGTLRHPVALDRVGLGGAVEAGLDPCAVYQVHLDLAPGESHEVVFVVGQAEGRSEAVHLARTYANLVRARQTAQQVADFWNENLGRVQVSTPDRATDLLLNRWLLYQTIACRLWGRSALYQSSGAYGYRDQLQDVLALLHTRPDLTREHILRAAEHQFEEGDVLHWWHPPASRGVRTRMTDDLLWLPYVVTHYIEVTGDAEILGESISFLKADPLGPDEAERYAQYSALGEPASLFDHCLRALERGTTSSQRGLPLIGHGDWNDGMNRVGIGGQGESVWLGWFLYSNLSRFADLCDQLGENMRATRLRQQAEDLRHALNANAWDGQWYIRATYDDGCPLGSAASDECQIDAIAQSWAVLSGAADPKRAEEAMASVYERLVREDDRLVLLFTPPFDRTQRDPGYIKGYPPGIRENGGQYTHAAMWTVWSFAALDQGNLAGRLFSLLNPIQHSDTVAKRNRYRVEPYVVSADVYGAPPHTGRGGWTWYTGSSGWMYRLGLEAILGIRRRADTLTISPCIPSDWTEYSVAYQYGGSTYHIQVRNPEAVCQGIRSVQVDGASAPPDAVHLRDDGCDHHIQMVMG
ncbi:MAG: hypothetical protein GX620_11550, partial [Chloroflexi bacterium]|nr:hypothetical protein [Chloroflexota bacterium]